MPRHRNPSPGRVRHGSSHSVNKSPRRDGDRVRRSDPHKPSRDRDQSLGRRRYDNDRRSERSGRAEGTWRGSYEDGNVGICDGHARDSSRGTSDRGERKRDSRTMPTPMEGKNREDVDGAERKRRRLEKLQQWKMSQGAGKEASALSTKQSSASKAAWTPWDDPTIGQNTALPSIPPNHHDIPEAVLRKRAEATFREAERLRTGAQEDPGGDIDTLDAFMATEIMPEVKAKEAEERRKLEEERLERLKQHAEGKTVKLPKVLEDSDSEEDADLEVEVPMHKVKLVIGPNGQKIQEIQRKSRCRLQVKKDAAELNRAFGSGPDVRIPSKDGQTRMTTIMLFGDARGVEVARRLIEEAVENKEQKQKQRQKEYEQKRDAKRRERQLYHLRHTRDYEALGLPIGSSKADVKRAYKKLAIQWHPDKHRDNEEEAKSKFQEIQCAYQNLMTTDEDERVEQIGT